MTSSFEQGTDRHILAIATPHECIPASSFKKKFRSHVESEELKKVGVNPLEFTADSLKLGGQNCLINGVVSPDFSQNPTHPVPVSVGHRPPMGFSRKRTINAVDSNAIPKFGIPFNPKVCVSQETGHVQVPSAAVGGPTQAAAIGIQSPVPAAATSRRVAS